MTINHDQTEADRALKAKHRAMWALGDYPAVARDIVGDLGPVLVQASGVGPGERVLDVAAGSGNASIPAAAAGATVVASDLTPELFETGRKAAARGRRRDRRGSRRTPRRCPTPTRPSTPSCPASGSCSPRTTRPAPTSWSGSCRPGGTIGLLSWTPEGFIGQMFATMKPYAPAPPPGAQPPPLWGSEEHVAGPARRPRHRGRRRRRRRSWSTSSRRRPSSATTSRPTTARPSRSTGRSPTTRRRSPRWTVSSRSSPARFDRGTSGSSVLDWEYLLLTCERT